MQRVLALLLLGLIGLPAMASGQVIPITNPGFETDLLGDGLTNTDCTGWGNFNSGTLNPTQAQYPLEAPEGHNVAWAGSIGWISQQTPEVIALGHTYTLKVDVGHRLDMGWPGYRVRLIAGGVGVVLAEDLNGVAPAAGEFLTTTLTYVGGSPAGLPLVITLYSYGTQVNFDNVRLYEATDLADAPDSYGTLRASDGARHPVVAGYQMGSAVDDELDGQPSPGANGDDNDHVPDDEDGVTLPGVLVAGEEASLTVVAGTEGGLLDAWIDYDRDGTFDHPAEHVFAGVSASLTSGPNPLLVSIPGDVDPGATYARFRLSAAGGLLPTGEAPEGEVEDYAVVVESSTIGVGEPDGYQTRLLSNLPNPFERSSAIRYELAVPGEVRIQIYDVLGRLVQELRAVHAQPGRFEIPWQGTDFRGRSVPPGVYLYRMTGPDFTRTRRAIKIG